MLPNSVPIWRGRSRLSGEPIVAALVRRSSATKTGPVAGLLILPEESTALALRPHRSICPAGCPLRDTGGCYVRWDFAPRSVQRAIARRPVVALTELRPWLADRTLRLGLAGDPAALPIRLVRELAGGARSVVGYSHAWRRRDVQALRAWCMASVESPAAAAEARALGWRTFRIRPPGSAVAGGEIDCPSAQGAACAACRLCGGVRAPTGLAPSITIEAHGGAVAARVAARIAEPVS